MKTSYVLSTLALVSLAFATGCKVSEDEEAAQGSAASFESSADLNSVASTYSDALKALPSGTDIPEEDKDAYIAEASAALETAMTESFAGCATPYPADDDPRTVGVQFNCTGTNGIVSLTGILEGNLEAIISERKVVGARITMDTTDLVASGRPIVGGLELVYTIATDVADLSMDFTATDEKAGEVDILVAGEVAAASTCVQFDGNILATGASFELDITVNDFERCENACPSEGGSANVQVTDSRGSANLTIGFTGTAKASVTSSRGKSFEIDLNCAGEGG